MIRTMALGHASEQTWRNGGGSTRELLAWPEATDWQARISVAEITRDGPFSAFAGVQRWFAVLRA
jgi:environmental stress-induced protein Ves